MNSSLRTAATITNLNEHEKCSEELLAHARFSQAHVEYTKAISALMQYTKISDIQAHISATTTIEVHAIGFLINQVSQRNDKKEITELARLLKIKEHVCHKKLHYLSKTETYIDSLRAERQYWAELCNTKYSSKHKIFVAPDCPLVDLFLSTQKFFHRHEDAPASLEEGKRAVRVVLFHNIGRSTNDIAANAEFTFEFWGKSDMADYLSRVETQILAHSKHGLVSSLVSKRSNQVSTQFLEISTLIKQLYKLSGYVLPSYKVCHALRANSVLYRHNKRISKLLKSTCNNLRIREKQKAKRLYEHIQSPPVETPNYYFLRQANESLLKDIENSDGITYYYYYSNEIIDRMKNLTIQFMMIDGTFTSTLDRVQQVVVLAYSYNDMKQVFGVVIVNSRRNVVYKRILAYFRALCVLNYIEYVTADFEMAIISAIKHYNWQYRPCYYHFSACIERQLLWLSSFFNACTRIRTEPDPEFIQKLKLVLFVPHFYRSRYLTSIYNEHCSSIKEFAALKWLFKYVYDFVCVGRLKHVSYAYLADENTTNNFVESMNNQLKKYNTDVSNKFELFAGIRRLLLPSLNTSKTCLTNNKAMKLIEFQNSFIDKSVSIFTSKNTEKTSDMLSLLKSPRLMPRKLKGKAMYLHVLQKLRYAHQYEVASIGRKAERHKNFSAFIESLLLP